MAIQIDIQTTGVNTLERAAAAFRKMSESAEGADAAFKGLSSTEQKLVTHFRATAAAAGTTAEQLVRMVKSVEEVERSMSVFQRMGQPFTKLSSDLQYVVQNVILLEKELAATSALASEKLGSAAYMGLVTQTKAAVELQRQLNAEIEKQGKLRADLAMLNTSNEVNPTLRLEAETLKEAIRQTELLATEKKRLVQSNNDLTVSEERLANARAALKQGGYQAQINAEERLAKARESLAQGANQALINSEERLANARAALKQGGYQAQINKETAAFNAQAAALDKLGSRLNTLGSKNLPVEQLRGMKQSLYELNLELAKTGKVNVSGIASLSGQLRGLESNIVSSSKGFTDWGKSAKFAIGGVARSFGAMTYSYSQLVPLLAGIAVGATIKEVYQLGAAIEYSLTFANALDESLSKLSVGAMTDQLLNQKGLRQGPEDLAKAVLEFNKAGIDSNEVLADMGKGMTQLGEVSRFAALGEMEIAEAVKVVVGQHYAFGESFVDIANKITVAAAESATDIKAMSAAFAYTTELATVSKVTFSELATAMALMANKGIEGTKAGTALRTAILKMQKPSEKLKGLLDDLGISWSAFTKEGQVKSLKTMVQSLKDVTENLPEPQRIAVLTELFGLRELKAGAVLLDSTGEKWDEMWKKIDEAPGSGDAQSALQKLNEQLSNTAEHLKDVLAASFKNSLAKAYDPGPVAQMLKDLDAVANSSVLIDSLSSTTDALNAVGVSITGVLRLAIDLYEYLTKFRDFKADTGNDSLDKAINNIVDSAWKALKNMGLVKDAYADIFKMYDKFVRLPKADKNKSAVASATTNSTDPMAVAFADKALDRLSPEQFKHYQKLEKGAELTAKTIERIFAEIDIDVTPLTKYQQEIAKIPEEAAKYIDKYKTTEFTQEETKRVQDRLKEAINTKYLKEMQDEIDKLSFDNFIKELENTGDIADKQYAALMKVQMQAREFGDKNGAFEPGNTKQYAAYQAYLKELARAQGIYIDETERMAASTRILGAEIKKLSEEKFGPQNGALTSEKMSPFFASVKSGIVEGLPLLTEWDQKLIEIEKRVANFKELNPSINDDQLVAFRNELLNIEKIDAFQKIGKQVEELKFSTMIGDLQRSKEETDKYANSVNKVKASYLQLKEEAYKQLNSVGQAFKDLKGNITFGSVGVKQFEMMVKSSHLFEDAIRDAKKEVTSLKNSLQDMKFGFAKDLADVRTKLMSKGYAEDFNYSYDLTTIKQLKKAAEEAGKAGIEGRERQVELLKQAYEIAKSLETQTTKKDGSSGESVSRVRRQYAEMEALQKQLNALKEQEISKASKGVSALQSEQQQHESFIKSIQDGYGLSSQAAKGYQAVVAENVNGTIVWKDTTVATVGEVKSAWEAVGQTIKEIPPPPEMSETAQKFFSSGSYMKEAATAWKEMTEAEQKFWSFGLSDKPKIIAEATTAVGEQKRTYEELTGVLDGQKGKYSELSTAAKESFGASAEAAGGYINIVADSGEGMTEWKISTLESLREVTEAWKALGETIKNLPKPPEGTSNYGGERALGGSVSSGKSYLVGEVGPELFTPRSNGFITPNNKISSSRDSIDINLSVNGSEPVTVQGDSMTVAKLERMFRENKRYKS